ncbi:unnamed protein product [Brassica napus]|uniref:(rape) hypothetical protein n=1 Tax=Brassica napus TaxID=3708 RepID=A0A816X0C7_BRANA|nr:unnamed protein product [Brassica napus]
MIQGSVNAHWLNTFKQEGSMYSFKLGELEVGLSEINANNDKLQHFYYELVEYKLLLDKEQSVDPTEQVKLGLLIGLTTSMVIVIYPAGLMNLLRHFQHEYKNPEIFIMENVNPTNNI